MRSGEQDQGIVTANARPPGSSLTRWVSASLVGLLAATLTVLRLWVRSPDALTEQLWAQDGLFVLCSRKVGPIACSVDSFQGSYSFGTKILAGIASALPITAWPLSSLAVTAVLFGGCAAATFHFSSPRVGRSFAFLLALIPALAPALRLDMVATLSATWLPLIYALLLWGTVAPPRRGATATIITVVAVAGLTTPLAVVFVLPLAWAAITGQIQRRTAVTLGAVATVASILNLQLGQRLFFPHVASDGATSAIDRISSAVTLSIERSGAGPSQTNEQASEFWTSVPTALVVIVTMILIAAALWAAVTRPTSRVGAAGVLTLSGFAALLVSTFVLGGPSAGALLFAALLPAAVVVAVSSLPGPWRVVGLAVTAVLLAALWAAGFTASEFRATVSPSWATVLEGGRTVCTANPGAVVNLAMSPDWPQFPLPDPTSPTVTCQEVLRWLGPSS